MKKFKVSGIATVDITVIVEAEDCDDAINKANETVPGLTQYAGGEMVGVDAEGATCDGGYDIEWHDAEEEEE